MAWANFPRSGIHEAAPDFTKAVSVAVPYRCVAGTVGPTSFLFHSLIFSDVLLWAMDSDAEENAQKNLKNCFAECGAAKFVERSSAEQCE